MVINISHSTVSRFVILIALLMGIILFTSGCSNDSGNKEHNVLVVQKPNGDNGYEDFREVDNKDKVNQVTDILDNANWREIEVSAPPPDYKFHFKERSKENKSNQAEYHLWITSSKENIELRYWDEDKSKFVKLNKEKSSILFKVITGEKLSNDK